MTKLTLDLDALCVESFDTAAADVERRGTVHANERVDQIYPASEFDLECTGGASAEGSCKTCVTCRGVVTDPCLCDPIHPL